MQNQERVPASADSLVGILHHAALRLNRHEDLNQLLHDVLDLCLDAIHADSCLVYLHEPATQQLVLRASSNAHPDELGRLSIPVGEGITGWVAQQRRPVAIAENASSDSRFKFYGSLPEDRYQAFLSVPILNRDQVLGVINLQHREPHAHQPLEIQTIAALGMMVGVALERDELRERVEQLEQAMATRKLIERAKGLLQQERKISEDEAYRLLQQESRRNRRPMSAVAEAILTSRALRNKL